MLSRTGVAEKSAIQLRLKSQAGKNSTRKILQPIRTSKRERAILEVRASSGSVTASSEWIRVDFPNSSRKKSRSTTYAIKRHIRVGRASELRNVIKGEFRFPSTAMRRFCGFPIGLITLPVVTANAREKSISLGEILYFLEKPRTSGVPIIARVSFIRIAERIPVEKSISKTSWSVDFALETIRFPSQARYPLLLSASPTQNAPKRKRSTSILIAARASSGEISPSNSTSIAPKVMICQICSLKDPICLRAVSTKTPRRTSTERSGKDTGEDSINSDTMEPTNLRI